MLLPLALILGGCVVKQYGGAVQTAQVQQEVPPANFGPIESELDTMITAERDDVDRRDRLEAAWEMLQQAKKESPPTQHVVHRYLTRILDLEKRGAAGSTSAIATQIDARFTPITSIKGEDIEVEEVPVTSEADAAILPETEGASSILDAARRRMNGGDLAGAMAQLEVCKDKPCWAQAEGLWTEVRDRRAYQEQEQAGKIFVAARALADKQVRLEKLQEARGILIKIQERYPNSRYAAGIADKIKQVDLAISEAIDN